MTTLASADRKNSTPRRSPRIAQKHTLQPTLTGDRKVVIENDSISDDNKSQASYDSATDDSSSNDSLETSTHSCDEKTLVLRCFHLNINKSLNNHIREVLDYLISGEFDVGSINEPGTLSAEASLLIKKARLPISWQPLRFLCNLIGSQFLQIWSYSNATLLQMGLHTTSMQTTEHWTHFCVPTDRHG